MTSCNPLPAEILIAKACAARANSAFGFNKLIDAILYCRFQSQILSKTNCKKTIPNVLATHARDGTNQAAMTNVHNRNVSSEECDCRRLKRTNRTNARAGECQNKIGRKLDLLSGKINPVFQSTIHDYLALILENVLSEINLSKSISSCK